MKFMKMKRQLSPAEVWFSERLLGYLSREVDSFKAKFRRLIEREVADGDGIDWDRQGDELNEATQFSEIDFSQFNSKKAVDDFISDIVRYVRSEWVSVTFGLFEVAVTGKYRKQCCPGDLIVVIEPSPEAYWCSDVDSNDGVVVSESPSFDSVNAARVDVDQLNLVKGQEAFVGDFRAEMMKLQRATSCLRANFDCKLTIGDLNEVFVSDVLRKGVVWYIRRKGSGLD